MRLSFTKTLELCQLGADPLHRETKLAVKFQNARPEWSFEFLISLRFSNF
jgi:hypothetical protein